MDMDTGTLILRLAIGPMLIAHGANKVFGPGGPAGTERWFAALGLRPAWLHARLAAASEVITGVLVAAGLLTGLASAGCVGLMAVAALTDHRGKGYFVFKGGNEYTVFVAATALALAALGPGAWSLDEAFGLDLAGAWWAAAAAVLGGASATLLLAVCYRRQPAEPSTAPS